MKLLRLFPLFALPFLAALSAAEKSADKNCGCTCCTGKEVCCCHAAEAAATAVEKPADAPPGHPLRGVIVEVRADRSALLVKHEEVPGVMKAMTMLLRVDAPTLAAAQKDQPITATLYKHDGAWWLRDVQPAPAK